MSDFLIGIFLFTGCFLLFAILYVYSKFYYSIEKDALIVRWLLLRIIPFRKYEIKFSEIVTVEYSNIKLFPPRGLLIMGNLFVGGRVFSDRGIIIKTRKWLVKNIYTTPDNPSEIMDYVLKRISLKTDV